MKHNKTKKRNYNFVTNDKNLTQTKKGVALQDQITKFTVKFLGEEIIFLFKNKDRRDHHFFPCSKMLIYYLCIH